MRRSLTVSRVSLKLREAFRISGHVFDAMPGVRVEIAEGSSIGRGEASGVYYTGDDVDHMLASIEVAKPAIEEGAGREELRGILSAGGARNALDCALWELESLTSGKPVFELVGLSEVRPLVTTFTLPVECPEDLVSRVEGERYRDAIAIKLKLEGDIELDAARVRAVRSARPDAWLGVDANQGYRREELDRLIDILVATHVELLEQPLPRGQEIALEGLKSPIPIAADESILDLGELLERHHSFDVINIKLDKCGGLTEALMIASEARALGKKVMVGNMAGSTLAAAPGFVLGQYCDLVDLDGPFVLASDPMAETIYSEGRVEVPASFWGAP